MRLLCNWLQSRPSNACNQLPLGLPLLLVELGEHTISGTAGKGVCWLLLLKDEAGHLNSQKAHPGTEGPDKNEQSSFHLTQ